MKRLTTDYNKTAITKFGVFVSALAVCPMQAYAVDVSDWAGLNTAENILVTADIQASGTPQSITLNTENQVIDGGNHSLTGAAGYKITVKGDNFVLQNFGKTVDGTEESHTYSYTDAEGNTVYKTISASISGFTNTVPFNFSKHFSISNSVYSGNTNTASLLKISNGADITNSVFYNNRNTGSWQDIISFNGGTLNIDNTIFDSNRTQGAILCVNSQAVITNSIFQNNITTYMGSIDIESGQVEISNSQFINNSNYEGGAINQTVGFKSATDTIFKGNVSNYDKGGAINLPIQEYDPNDPYFLNVTFEDNTAASYGGGIYISGAGTRNHYSHFVNSTFSGNSAEVGGGIFTGNLVALSIVDTDFTDNTAAAGGAIYAGDMSLNIYAHDKDVTFSGNTATDSSDDFNAGAAVFFEITGNDAEMNVNAASDKKVVFDDTIAAYSEDDGSLTLDLNINKGGLSYNLIDDTSVDMDTTGEVQFNDKVGDENGNVFNINLYGGMLSVGQNAELNGNIDNPDGLINSNNFTVAGDSILNTVNGVIGEFAPKTFQINADLQYHFDVDLANAVSDKLTGAENNGSLTLAVLNVISDTDEKSLKVTYSDTNINGILKDDYAITTSEASYSVSAGNDDTGSYLVFAQEGDSGGLPNAIKNASDVYSITSDADETVDSWEENDLKADLVINGNNHAIVTENGLDGINVGSDYKLTMNDVTDINGFNYAFANSGTVELNNTTIHDAIINDGIMDINRNVSLGEVSGKGTTNINADHELKAKVSGNTVNVNKAKLSGVDNLASDVKLNVAGGEIALDNKQVALKSANFDANSTLSLSVNSLSDYGSLSADTITVAEGAKLKATLAQGIVRGKTASLQLLSASNSDFNNFSDSFDNNMYRFEKADKNGLYNITLKETAEDVVTEEGASPWVADAVKAYVDELPFEEGTVAAEIADQLAALAQNDAQALIKEIKALAPLETAAVQGQAVDEVNRLFKTVDGYLRGERDALGASSGDVFDDVSIWAKPYLGESRLGNRGKIAGFSTNSRGVIVGIEKKLNSELKIGAGLQYDKTDIDAMRRTIEAGTKVAFFYGEYKPDQWFVNAVFSYAQSDYDEHKHVLGSQYSAKYDVYTKSVTAVTGYQFEYFTPEAGLRYYRIKRDSYTDNAMQNVNGVETDILRATGGVHFKKIYGKFSPDLYLGLTYDIAGGKDDTVVNLSNGTRYTVEGKRLPRLGYELNFGLNAHLTDSISVGASYIGAYRENYREHTGMLMFKYDF